MASVKKNLKTASNIVHFLYKCYKNFSAGIVFVISFCGIVMFAIDKNATPPAVADD